MSVVRSKLEPSGAGGSAYPAIDTNDFKAALGSFATGVTVGTTCVGEEVRGITASAVMSVSLDPPLVLLSIQSGSRMHALTERSANFALSVLAAGQREVAEYFADSSQPHDGVAFTRFASHPGATGAPLLDGALAHIDCLIVDRLPAGDHTLFIGRVVKLESLPDAAPLLYFRGRLG